MNLGCRFNHCNTCGWSDGCEIYKKVMDLNNFDNSQSKKLLIKIAELEDRVKKLEAKK